MYSNPAHKYLDWGRLSGRGSGGRPTTKPTPPPYSADEVFGPRSQTNSEMPPQSSESGLRHPVSRHGENVIISDADATATLLSNEQPLALYADGSDAPEEPLISQYRQFLSGCSDRGMEKEDGELSDISESDGGVEIDTMSDGEAEGFTDEPMEDFRNAFSGSNPDEAEKRIKQAWKKAGQPACQEVMLNGEICGMKHPQILHNEELAMEAHRTRKAEEHLRRAAPHLLKPQAMIEQEKAAARLARKKKSSDKYKQKRAVAKISSGRTPDKGFSQGRERGRRRCGVCGKYHSGTCRQSQWQIAPSQPDNYAQLAPEIAAQMQSAASISQRHQPMAPEQMMQYAILNASGPEAIEELVKLSNLFDQQEPLTLAPTPPQQKESRQKQQQQRNRTGGRKPGESSRKPENENAQGGGR